MLARSLALQAIKRTETLLNPDPWMGIAVALEEGAQYLQLLLRNDSDVRRLRLEIKHPDSIDENHIETFCVVQKQRIDSRY